MPTNEVLKARMRGLYDRVPVSKCRKQCHWTCGPVFFSNTEYELVPINLRRERFGWNESKEGVEARERQFHTGQPVTAPACPYLTSQNECGVYEYRPLMCRTWGNVNNRMNQCPHGCRPEMSEEQWLALFDEYVAITKEDGTVDEWMSEEGSDTIVAIGCPQCGCHLLLGTADCYLHFVECECGWQHDLTEEERAQIEERLRGA